MWGWGARGLARAVERLSGLFPWVDTKHSGGRRRYAPQRAAGAQEPERARITIDDFKRVDLPGEAEVVAAEPVPKSKKLLRS